MISKVQDWTFDDVGEWLTNLGLSDYIETFQNNHISGKNILDITDQELRDDLGMSSVGHRKNFSKSQEHLKKIYSKNKIFNQAIRLKLKKFYEKHKNHLRSNLHAYKFHSIRNSLIINSEIIEEDQSDQVSMKESMKKESEMNNHSRMPRNKKISIENDVEENEEPAKLPEKENPPSALRKTKSKKLPDMTTSINENSKKYEFEINNNFH